MEICTIHTVHFKYMGQNFVVLAWVYRKSVSEFSSNDYWAKNPYKLFFLWGYRRRKGPGIGIRQRLLFFVGKGPGTFWGPRFFCHL